MTELVQPPPKAFLSARLPPGLYNGLPATVPQLLAQLSGGRHTESIYAVVRLDALGLTRDRHTDLLVPTARVLAIEPLLDAQSSAQARELLRRSYAERTGIQEQLFEI